MYLNQAIQMSLRDVKVESNSGSSSSSSNENLSSIAELSECNRGNTAVCESDQLHIDDNDERKPAATSVSLPVTTIATEQTQLIVRPSKSEEGWKVFADENEDSNHSLSEILSSSTNTNNTTTPVPVPFILPNQETHFALSEQTQVSQEDKTDLPFDDYYLRMFTS